MAEGMEIWNFCSPTSTLPRMSKPSKRKSRSREALPRGARARSETVALRAATNDGGVAAYVRVSSPAQSVGSQRDAVSRACAARGEAIGTWYVERASGATLARPELQRLRADVREGRVRVLWVYRLDRLTRSGIRDTLGLLGELRGRGCVVRSVADALPDMDGSMGDVVVAFLAWAAQVEREALRERQAAARAKLEASGRTWGRPRLASEKAAWVLAQLRKRRPVVEIAKASGISESTVRRLRRSHARPSHSRAANRGRKVRRRATSE